jgi:hypothetical protein
MKRTLTDADRLELKAKLFDRFPQIFDSKGMIERATLSNDLVQFMSEFYESKNTFSDGIKQEREEETDDPQFKGVAYEKDIDQKALKQGFFKVFVFLATHAGWYLDTEIAEHTGVYVPSVQRYRSYCCQPEFGGHIIERRRRAGCRIFEYRMIPNKESKTWKQVQNFPYMHG